VTARAHQLRLAALLLLLLAGRGTATQPIIIRGRGHIPAVIEGWLHLEDARHVQLSRLRFASAFETTRGEEVEIDNCTFSASASIAGVSVLTLRHCRFAGDVTLPRSTDITLAGNRLDGPRPRLDDGATIRYSDVGDTVDADTDILGRARGPASLRRQPPRLMLTRPPRVHSVGTTAANIEWHTTLPATCEIAWGTTSACAERDTFDVDCFGSYSLTGLAPATTYYFRITALRSPRDIRGNALLADVAEAAVAAQPISFWFVDGLVIRNCAMLNKYSALYLQRCPDLLIEHTVFVRPMIGCFVLRNYRDEPATLRRNIFTDMLKKKARLNISMLVVDGPMQCPRVADNCFYLRMFTPEDRHIIGRAAAPALPDCVVDPLFADPRFAGDASPPDAFGAEWLVHPNRDVDFNTLFATAPALVARDVGLQREAFADFHFNRHAAD
jgi:hypothetical protein